MKKFLFITSAFLFIVSSTVHAQTSPISVKFNVVPVQVPSFPADLNFKLSFDLNPNATPGCPWYNSAFTNGFYWSVEERYQGTQGDYYRLVKTGFSSWPNANSPVVLDFTDTVSPVGGPHYLTFWASADCSSYTGGGLIQSSLSTVENLSGDKGFIETDVGFTGQSQPVNFQLQNPVVGNPTNVLGLGIIIANWIFNISIPITVILIIYAGFSFLVSRGNPSKVQGARRLLWYTVIGLAIVLIGKGFIVFIQSILG